MITLPYTSLRTYLSIPLFALAFSASVTATAQDADAVINFEDNGTRTAQDNNKTLSLGGFNLNDINPFNKKDDKTLEEAQKSDEQKGAFLGGMLGLVISERLADKWADKILEENPDFDRSQVKAVIMAVGTMVATEGGRQVLGKGVASRRAEYAERFEAINEAIEKAELQAAHQSKMFEHTNTQILSLRNEIKRLLDENASVEERMAKKEAILVNLKYTLFVLELEKKRLSKNISDLLGQVSYADELLEEYPDAEDVKERRVILVERVEELKGYKKEIEENGAKLEAQLHLVE